MTSTVLVDVLFYGIFAHMMTGDDPRDCARRVWVGGRVAPCGVRWTLDAARTRTGNPLMHLTHARGCWEGDALHLRRHRGKLCISLLA